MDKMIAASSDTVESEGAADEAEKKRKKSHKRHYCAAVSILRLIFPFLIHVQLKMCNMKLLHWSGVVDTDSKFPVVEVFDIAAWRCWLCHTYRWCHCGQRNFETVVTQSNVDTDTACVIVSDCCSQFPACVIDNSGVSCELRISLCRFSTKILNGASLGLGERDSWN